MAKLTTDELKAEISSLCAELRQVESVVAHLNDELIDLHEELAPAKSEQSYVMDQILASHGGQRRFSFAGAPARVPLFAELMAIAEVWGPTRQLRARTYTEYEINRRLAKRIGRQIERLETQLKRRKP